jgi:site-specific DNA-cytosine methylase
MTEDIFLRRNLRHGTKEDGILSSLTENERSELQAILNMKNNGNEQRRKRFRVVPNIS